MTEQEKQPHRPQRESGSGISPEDLSLLESYLGGEPEAFATIQQWIQVGLRGRYPGLSREHEDLVQTTHGKLLVSLREGRFAGGKGLRAYVSGVVHHAAIDRLREIYRGRVLSDALVAESEAVTSTPPDNPYAAAEAQDESHLLHQALMAVPASCRELWQLMLVEKLSYEEIAEKISVPLGTVKSRMWHCRRKALSALRRLRFLQESGGRAARER